MDSRLGISVSCRLWIQSSVVKDLILGNHERGYGSNCRVRTKVRCPGTSQIRTTDGEGGGGGDE